MPVLLFRKSEPAPVERRDPAPLLLFLKGGIKNHPGYVLTGFPPRWHLFDPAKHAPEHILYHAKKTYHVAAVKKLKDLQHADATATAADMVSQVEAHAKADQDAATLSAAVSGWKSSMLAGKTPTPAQKSAMASLMETDPSKAAKTTAEVVKQLGHEKFMATLGVTPPVDTPTEPVPVAPTVAPEPASHDLMAQAAIDQHWPVLHAVPHEAVPRVLGSLSSSLGINESAMVAAFEAKKGKKVVMPGPQKPKGTPYEYGQAAFAAGIGRAPTYDSSFMSDHVKSDPDGPTIAKMKEWYQGWDAANLAAPVASHQQPVGDTQMGLSSVGETQSGESQDAQSPKEGDTKEGADGTLVFHGGRWHKQESAQSNADVASAKVTEILAGKGGHYPGLAAQKLTGDAKWQTALPVEQLQMIVDLAKEMQAKASLSAAISGWKKAAFAGKNPSPAQWKAMYSLDAGKKSALLDEAKAKVGSWDHLKAPPVPAPDVSELVEPLSGIHGLDDKTDAAVAGWKAAMESGMTPTAAQAQAVEGLTYDQKMEVFQAAIDAHHDTMPASNPEESDANYDAASANVAALHKDALAVDASAPVKLLDVGYQKKGGLWESTQSGLVSGPGNWKYLALQFLSGDPVKPEDLYAYSGGGKVTAVDALVIDGHKPAEKVLNAIYPPVSGPSDGNIKVINGISYVLKNGHWHKLVPDSAGNAQKTAANSPQVENTGGWEFTPKNQGMSDAPTLTTTVSHGGSVYIGFLNGMYQVGMINSNGDVIDHEDYGDPGDAALGVSSWGVDVPPEMLRKLTTAVAGDPITEWKAQISAGKLPTLAQHDAYLHLPEKEKQKILDDIGVDGLLNNSQLKAVSDAHKMYDATHGAGAAAGVVHKMKQGQASSTVKVFSAMLHNTQPGHNKFYGVAVNGGTLIKKWGKIGTNGQSQTTTYMSHDAAVAAAKDLMSDKMGNGYKQVGVALTGEAPAATVSVQPSAKPKKIMVPAAVKKIQAVDAKAVSEYLHSLDDTSALLDSIPTVAGKSYFKSWASVAHHYLASDPSASLFQTQRAIGRALGAAFGHKGKIILKDGTIVTGANNKVFSSLKGLIETDPAKAQALFIAAKMGGAPVPQPTAPQPAAPEIKVAGPKDGDTKTENGKTYKLIGGRWHLMGQPQASTGQASTAGPKVVKAKSGDKYVGSMDGWKKTGGQLGSNEGGVYTDKNGQQWYVKFPKDPAIARNEFLATKFYEMLGADVPSLRLVDQGGKVGIASKWQTGLKKGSAAQLADAKKGFVLDAWLSNWDVVGLANDNLLIGPKGLVRVDAGGALKYRAQGGEKGEAFGDTVPELESLLDPVKNPKTAAVFAGITPADMQWGITQLGKIKPSQIEELCEKVGPGSAADKAALAKKLIARRKFILDKFGVHDPWVPKHPDMAKLPVNPADVPAPLDFSTMSGGKPLSSTAWVNEKNSADSAALIAFAKKGNLQALKDYQYDAVDKATGAAAGKKPITEHPSQHIQKQWTELVELLQSIAYPPVQALDMPALGVAANLQDLAEMVGYFDPQERVETVAAEHRMGFFMKAGLVDGIHEMLEGMQFKHQTPQSKWVQDCKAKFNSFSGATKAYIAAIQASGWVNHIFSQGKSQVNVSGNGGKYNGGIQGLAAKSYADAVEIPEGTIIKRGMHDTTAGKSMTQQLLSATPGLVIQNTDSMCCSYKEGWGWGGDVQLTIKCGKGCKALPSFASGHFQSEHEVTTLPGARFVVLSSKKVGSQTHVELLMLPPHEGYVAELGKLQQMGKAFLIFINKAMYGRQSSTVH